MVPHGQADVPFASVCHYRMGRADFTYSYCYIYLQVGIATHEFHLCDIVCDLSDMERAPPGTLLAGLSSSFIIASPSSLIEFHGLGVVLCFGPRMDSLVVVVSVDVA